MNKYKKLRKEINISQTELADILGVSQTAVSQWETGKNYPDVKTLKMLAEIFCVSADYLLDIDSTTIRTERDTIVYTRVPAGIDWSNNIERDGTVEIPTHLTSHDRKIIGYKVIDDSLAPTVWQNDILLIELTNEFREGDMVLMQYSGYDGKIGFVFTDKKGILIEPLKPGIPGQYFPYDQKEKPRILGVVRELIRNF